MQRYTAHATSEGSLRETEYFYEQVIHTAEEFGMKMPNLAAMQSYLEQAKSKINPGMPPFPSPKEFESRFPSIRNYLDRQSALHIIS